MIGMQWNIIKGIIIIVAFILLLSAFIFFINVRPFRNYDPDTPDRYGINYEEVTFNTSDKITIHAWLMKPEKSDGTVIIGHGYPFNKGNILSVAKFLYPDYTLLFYDHRYFGQSSGSATSVGAKEAKDVEAAVTFIRKKYGKAEPIALYGFSLSASAALMAKTEVNAIIADSSYADLESMVKQMYWIFGPLKYPFVKVTSLLSKIFFGVYPKEVSPAESVKDIKAPILLIHGEKDMQIPVKHAYSIKESNPDIELWVVAGARHGQAHATVQEEYEKRVKDFLKKNMK
ncbi:MAG: alpha/beta fold hydrolase [Candidatus Woesearchaeota archaeon]